MCGIMGYVGTQSASDILVDGLKRLEYRGYDSAGIAVYQDGEIAVARAKGKLKNLESRLSEGNFHGVSGIGHTRWATHGKPSDENAHPHRSENVVVVHNGIIENYLELREKLAVSGVTFQSETDTEIVPFLIDHKMAQGKTLEEAVYATVAELKGAFAFAIFSKTHPMKVVAAKNASPLIMGIGEGENFIASDIPALLSHTRDVVILEDGEVGIITNDSWSVTDFNGKLIDRKPRRINWSRVMAEKEGYKHFMLKEIHEQPRAVTDTLRGRIAESTAEVILDGVNFSDAVMNQNQTRLVSCMWDVISCRACWKILDRKFG